MPLLFAATLFVSASLLFMVQPMVGKMVLPLLGGSPAVWNACMVFFQALLLLGYLYAHHVSAKYTPRQQWLLHLLVLGLPLAAFFLAVTFTARNSPIAIAESLAPTGDSSPVLSVLLLLTVAIGVPFFVVSTSAPLLQKWFTCTGHPAARDPYFLYSASNIGSMISLLGYPLFIEPYLSIIGQAWVFAVGFAVLAVLVALCGFAAANPIGVPPMAAQNPAKKPVQQKGSQQQPQEPAAAKSPVSSSDAPTWERKLKWITLAFVPSSLMLGVTFYMTTDIASIPLLWVGPLALYLITFIIAFARLPDWFRLVIGNLAPVMVLLLVFVMLARDVLPFSIGITLLIHLLTFFAAALMCHYELARDRPSPQYLTEFFLLMSVGGVLGGIFNSLLAPLIFPHAYEYRIVLVLACLMVPKLTENEEEDKKERERARKEAEAKRAAGNANNEQANTPFQELQGFKPSMPQVFDIAIPVAVGVAFYFYQKLPGVEWFSNMLVSISKNLSVSVQTVVAMLIYGVPVMLCFFFVDRPLRFALSVAAILGYATYKEESGGIYSERSFFGILKIEEHETYQRPAFKADTMLTDDSLLALHRSNVPDTIIAKIAPLRNLGYTQEYFIKELEKALTQPELDQWKNTILDQVRLEPPRDVFPAKIQFRRLVHGTTLHGTQIYAMQNNVYDMFQALTALNPWDNLAVAGANHAFDPRQEPLTYYHRSGPVGAMINELRTRKNGADAKAHFAMVGLGTGSASCYAQPGQKLDFYEIDPAVRHLTYDTDKYFSYVTGAKQRGAIVDIHMGDARLKLKENTDRKYALLLVDAFSSDSIPVHLLTKEAVQLYLDRMTPDGILALHISNKFVRLEPVVAAIARDLNLVARVWSDDNEKGGPGKTASSWVAVARTKEDLGELYSPIGDLPFSLTVEPGEDDRMRFSLEAQLYKTLIYDYRELNAGQKSKADQLNESENATKAWLDWIKNKLQEVKDPKEKQRLELIESLMANRSGPYQNLHDIMIRQYGHAFRRLEIFDEVHAWTDDYSDVMRVMMIPELQMIRKFFGLPTPIER